MDVIVEKGGPAQNIGVGTVRGMVPAHGYVLSNPEIHDDGGRVLAAMAQTSA